jgi:hypothetical protein
MRHLDDTLAARLALNTASVDDRKRAEEHARGCERCRRLLEDTHQAWDRLEADPATLLPDLPVWPGVAAALDAQQQPASGRATPVLRPRWRTAVAEARRRPLAYASLLLVVASLVGGNLAGRLVWTAPAASTRTEELSDYTTLSGLPEGSLSAFYLATDLNATTEETGQ